MQELPGAGIRQLGDWIGKGLPSPARGSAEWRHSPDPPPLPPLHPPAAATACLPPVAAKTRNSCVRSWKVLLGAKPGSWACSVAGGGLGGE